MFLCATECDVMTIFQLLVWSCVRATSFGGDVVSMQCDWSPWGLHVSEDTCKNRAAASIGVPIHSFIMNGRTVDEAKCVAVLVNE